LATAGGDQDKHLLAMAETTLEKMARGGTRRRLRLPHAPFSPECFGHRQQVLSWSPRRLQELMLFQD